jgi:pyruvate dehydrogenase E2 component (dihydrolipoamide acetyltransferase)
LTNLPVNSRKLDPAELWLRDGLALCRPPAYFQTLDVDMSRMQTLIGLARQRNVRITYTHIIVRAAAVALAANPDLHVLVCAGRVYSPDRVDIGLSIAGETFVAPVLVVEGADRKSLTGVAEEIVRRAPEVKAADQKMLQLLRRWGWLLPFGFLRRALLRILFRIPAFRRRGSGTFQVSLVPNVDQAFTPMFSTSAILIAGSVRDRVVAIAGVPTVRAMTTLTCCADHGIWDGRAGERFLLAVRNVLETGALESELELPPEAVRTKSASAGA